MSWRAQGMRTWILQRLTAVYMLLYLLVFAGFVFRHPIHDFTDWQTLFTAPTTNIATLLFFYALLFHAWVGIRDILIDYVHVSNIRFFLWILINLGIIAMAIWISMILYSVVVL
jgi:succinate dehydrogenase / fumarate reductase membrane anchor subunit